MIDEVDNVVWMPYRDCEEWEDDVVELPYVFRSRYLIRRMLVVYIYINLHFYINLWSYVPKWSFGRVVFLKFFV